MKIGINLIQYKDIQGIEIFIKNLIAHLVVTSDDELILFTNQKSAEIFANAHPQARVVNRNFKLLNKLNLIFYQQFCLAKQLRKEKIDLLFCPSLAGPIFFKRKIVTIHDLAFRVFPKESNFFGQLYLRFSLLSAKYFSYKVATVSQFSKQEIMKILKIKDENIIVISEGVPELPAVSSETEDRMLKKFNLEDIKYFIYIGNVRHRKNLPATSKAFQEFLKSQAQYKFIVAGKKDSRMLELEKFVQDNNLAKQMLFPGFISETEKVVLIKNSQALVFTSLYEGFGLPVLEAQALGTPVITSSSSSLPEIAGRGALLVDPRDTKAIAEAMLQISRDKRLCQDLRTKGLENIKKYSWQKTADNLMMTIKSYENITNK